MPTPTLADRLPADITAIAESCSELRAGALEMAVSVRRLLEALAAVDASLATVAPPTTDSLGAVADTSAASANPPTPATGLQTTTTSLPTPAADSSGSEADRSTPECRPTPPASVTVPSMVARPDAGTRTIASILLAGQPATAQARMRGVEIEGSYYVLGLRIPTHPGERHVAVDGKPVARRRLRCVQAELAARCAGKALWVLGMTGGTVLIPESATEATELDGLITALSAVAQVALTATVMHSATCDVPGAAEQAHELLDIAHRLRCAPGLYRFDDLAMEYQLTRPGPGRDYLGALLDPLDEYPELLETLRRHLGNDLNRRRTARGLGVHANTVDYRLKRIGRLTGFDPSQSAGLWYLRSALVAHTYRAAGEHADQ
ncbi:PucR family transcriptional regulator [Nocardia sp. SYP-A9097]|uniref:helix-turn-helix domain-containing protein n=1 Tax=Nocardia sp. SYP-A9097 TaxID=2663237 RepID=UPI00129A9531|nr:helix-turn-helix domain-containing protein [Nocardia sp. SYP-A9097]MRH91506.1 PucR family transcriptional regulator [Nocardia sp. SYP-A9097]